MKCPLVPLTGFCNRINPMCLNKYLELRRLHSFSYLSGAECAIDFHGCVIVFDALAKICEVHSDYLPQEIVIIDSAPGNLLELNDRLPGEISAIFKEVEDARDIVCIMQV